jgi:hypothetical protein
MIAGKPNKLCIAEQLAIFDESPEAQFLFPRPAQRAEGSRRDGGSNCAIKIATLDIFKRSLLSPLKVFLPVHDFTTHSYTSMKTVKSTYANQIEKKISRSRPISCLRKLTGSLSFE